MIIPEIIYIYFYIQINNEKAFNLNIENKYQMNIKKNHIFDNVSQNT